MINGQKKYKMTSRKQRKSSEKCKERYHAIKKTEKKLRTWY